MKWIAISGSWRHTNEEVERDVRRIVREIIERGNGIVSGGALGVDFFATDEALRTNPVATQIKVFLPVSLDVYSTHYHQKADEGEVTDQQAQDLIDQLTQVKKLNPGALIEDSRNTRCNRETYFARNTDIVDSADELVAFQVNQSLGTQDAINKANERLKPVTIYSYFIFGEEDESPDERI